MHTCQANHECLAMLQLYVILGHLKALSTRGLKESCVDS